MRRGFRFMVCPECRKRGVFLQLGQGDCWVCRACGWSVWTASLNSNTTWDKERRAALATLNPDREVY